MSFASDPFAPFAPGTLWSTLLERARRARRRGALRPFATETRTLEEHGVAFQVHAVTSLAHRPRVSHRGDPFLPPDADLVVAGVDAEHLCVLNKYPVLDHHALVVTRRFEPQESVLTPGDFAAWWRCLLEYHALGFYNSGAIAGASQPHKHMQLVPLPLAPGPYAVPFDAWLAGLAPDTALGRVPRAPFRHAFRWFGRHAGGASLRARADEAHRLYRLMLAEIGFDPDAPGPYNLLLTRRYLLLVPRLHDRYEAIAVNALGFAGSFFVPTPAALDVISRAGPVAVLRHVSGR